MVHQKYGFEGNFLKKATTYQYVAIDMVPGSIQSLGTTAY